MNNYNNLGRILGLDIGKKRIGSALSDELRLTSSPYIVFEISSSLKKVAEDIVQECLKNKVHVIVVGLPLELDGSSGEQTKYTEKFIKTIYSVLNNKSYLKDIEVNEFLERVDSNNKIDIFIMDERFTSVQAENMIVSKKDKNTKRRVIKDNISASILVDTYLTLSQKILRI